MINWLIALRGDTVGRRAIKYSLVDQSLVSGVNFATGIIVARLIGMEQFGRFTLAWLVLLFFNSIQQALIISPMMTIGPKVALAEKTHYFGGVLAGQIVLATASSALLYGCVVLSATYAPEWNITPMAVPMAIALIGVQLQDFVRRYFFVTDHGELALRNDLAMYAGQALLILLVNQFAAVSAASILWAIALSSSVAVFMGWRSLSAKAPGLARFTSTASLHWKHAKWLLATAITQWFAGNLFIVALGAALGPTPVGAVRAAQNILGATSIILLGAENFIPTTASVRMHTSGAAILQKYLYRTGSILLVSILAFSLTVSIHPGSIMAIVYGGEYENQGYIVWLLVPVYVCYTLGVVQRAGLRALDRTAPIFYSSAISSLFSMVASTALIEKYGTSGALNGMAISQSLTQIILFIALRNELNKKSRS